MLRAIKIMWKAKLFCKIVAQTKLKKKRTAKRAKLARNLLSVANKIWGKKCSGSDNNKTLIIKNNEQ
jgi:hypothetical protein